jgi:hypothetical protein|tara:strand:- start:401 stop:1018 length:618 start_codon:yes stop_codon:yes gene_type:complete
MGFDIYGLQPLVNTAKPTILDKDWLELTDKQRDKYNEANNQYEDENPGIYFRNNNWWWRPLWGYIVENCEGILSKKEIESGGFNDGSEIPAYKVDEIVDVLEKLIEKKQHIIYEEKYKKDQSKLAKEKCTCCEGIGAISNKGEIAVEIIQDALNSKIKDKTLMKECHVCNGTGERENWGKSYPFDAENLENFVKFLGQSGGIRIC